MATDCSFILGCTGLAGLFRHVNQETVDEIIRIAVVKHGIRMFDTAPHYGCGLAEERLGIALNRLDTEGLKPGACKIWTKVGRVILNCNVSELDPSQHDIEYSNLAGPGNSIYLDTPPNRTPVFDYSSRGVQRSFEDSLQRLLLAEPTGKQKIYCLAGLRLHDFDALRHFEVAQSEGLNALVQLRNQDVIQDVSIGVNSSTTALECISRSEGLTSIMLANAWNLLDHPMSSLQVFDHCKQHNMQLHIAGVFASGALVGRDSYQYSSMTNNALIVERVAAWKKLCEVDYNIPLPVVAIAFVAHLLRTHAPGGGIAIGVGSAEELEEVMVWFNQAMMSTTVPAELWRDAKAMGLLQEHVLL